MLRGLMDLAALHKVTLIGGNVARSPGPLFLDVTLTGTVKRRRVLTRQGGRVGDALYVTGSLGAAAAGLAWLRGKADEAGGGALSTAGASDAVKDAVERFLRPQPRMRFGLIAGRTRAATACMDLSDGLADAVRQLARASGTGAVIEAEALPIHPGAAEILSGESKLQSRSGASSGGPASGGASQGGVVRRRGLRAAAGRFTSVAATFFGGSAAERRAGDADRDAHGGRRSGAAAGGCRRAAARRASSISR